MIDKQLKVQNIKRIIDCIRLVEYSVNELIINYDPHFNCSAGRAQNISGVDLMNLDSLLELGIQTVSLKDLITKNIF